MSRIRGQYVRRLASPLEATHALPKSPNWDALSKHPRYISEWDNDIVAINIAHINDKSQKLREFNLCDIWIAAGGPDSIHNERVELRRYPHLIQALKAAINETLHLKSAAVDDAVTTTINHALRFYSWMMRRGVYWLSQLTHQDTEEFATEWADSGWWKLARYDEALHKLLSQAKQDKELAVALCGVGNSKYFPVNTKAISELIGLPISGSYIPRYFTAELSEIVGNKKPLSARTPRVSAPTNNSFATCMCEINKLSLMPGAIDCIPRLPYINPNKQADERLSRRKGRTKNISLDDAIKLFCHAVNVVYEIGPAVVELAKIARGALEHALQNGLNDSHFVRRALTKALPGVKAKYKVPFDGITELSGSGLLNLIAKVLVGAFSLIASNHGRRRNEVIGHEVPHGLYHGCVQSVDGIEGFYKLDIYVAKSLQQYVKFWCNKLVRDSVLLLEELAQQFRPLYTEPKPYSPHEHEARLDKLFIFRPFTAAGFQNKPSILDFGRKAKHFFDDINLSPEYISERAHPFRRIFVLFYKHRYDNPVLLAMHQHLCHELLSSTRIYLNDPEGRKDSESAAALFRKVDNESKGFLEAMAEVDKEYFEEKILKLLKGEETGGVFPNIILRVMKTLTKNISFQQSPLREKAKATREHLEAMGYRADEKEHCVCFAGTASKTKGRSKCFKDGETHPEIATPTTCDGCIHMLTTSNYHRSILKSRDTLLVEAKSFALPPALRLAKQKEADFLTQYVARDGLVAEQNQKAVAKLIASWKKIVVCHEGSYEAPYL